MELLGVMTAFGLSASAGLNAYIPLLTVALLARFTNLIALQSPWDTLTSWWVIGVLVVLSAVEFLADKVPAVNHINDIIQTFIRPVAGAILFAASANVITDIHPILSLIHRVAGGRWCTYGEGRCDSPGSHSYNRGRGQCAGIHHGRCRLHSSVGFIRTHPDCSGVCPDTGNRLDHLVVVA